MNTYADRLKPFVAFKNKEQMDEQVTLFRRSIGYQLNKTDNNLLDYMKAYAVRYTGVFYQLLETIAENTGKSLPTVKRVLKKLVALGIIKRIPTRKENGRRKGATIYQFQSFELQNEPKKMSLRDSKLQASNTCERKDEAKQLESKPFISSKKDSKYTNTTAIHEKDLLIEGLLSKLPEVIAQTIAPFFDNAKDIYEITGTIFKAKAKVDEKIRVEDHEFVYRRSILSVITSWKYAIRNEKKFNVFGVMYKAISETTEAILNGSIYATPAQRKSSEFIPEWFKNRNEESKSKKLSPMEQEKARLEVMKKLGRA